MSGNENQRKWKHSESVTMRLCTWQTTELPCHGNAHNCLVSAMLRRHDEKWKIPKEKESCLAGHYTLEITSFGNCVCPFYFFYKLRTPLNRVRYTLVILLLLLLPPADDICVRNTGNVWELLLLHQRPVLCLCCCAYQWQLPTLPALGEKDYFSYLPASAED